MGALGLDDCPRVKVWHALLALIQGDDRLKGRSDLGIRQFGGKPGDKRPAAYNKPAEVLLIRGGGEATWVYADAHVEPLLVTAEITVRSLDHDLIDNVWAAVIRAIYPRDDHARAVEIARLLQEAGAETGLVEYTVPALIEPEKAADAGQIRARAMLKIDVLVQT